MAESEWFYGQNNQQRGPVSLQTLVDLLRSGQLQPADMVWREGMASWLPAGQVPELAGAVPAAPANYTGYQTGFQGQQGYGNTVGFSGPGAAPAGQSHYGTAMTAFVMSLVGFLLFGIILEPLALIFSIIALSGMGRTGNGRGKGFAIAGLIIAIIGTIFSIIGMYMITTGRFRF